MKKILISFCFIFFLSNEVIAEESLITIKQKLERIERDITDLQKFLFKENGIQEPNNSENESLNPEITVFDMRLRDIESELKDINLNYENISFEIEDLKKVVEGLTLELKDALITINTIKTDNINISSNDQTIIEPDESINIIETEIETDQENSLGKIKISSNDLSESDIISTTEEKTKQTTDAKINYSTPEQQFQAAFDNLRNQKFKEAKLDLETFIKEHSSHKLAGSAHYWLGEIYLLNKEYREAALVFAEGYQKYPDSIKSPDSLYKLAETLIKIEKKDEACNTLRQLILKYPNSKLIDKSESKIYDLQCS